jgi:nitrate reductase molybdenum cofactor assembly chaperone NarJ/NarW
MSKDSIAILYDLFADLLEYPTLATSLKAGHCYSRLQGFVPDAASTLEHFYSEIERQTLQKLEELYTVTFDMQPVCYPYVGYQLFGESYKRGAFMAQLNEAYHEFGYSAGQELPDHLAVVLRFIGLDPANRRGEFCQALLKEGVTPALEKMLQAFGTQSENPYFGLLSALESFLLQSHEKELGHA